jgi:lysylphosphatidylglycerol synthetase-like protein (DUF2156 family)
MASPPAAMPPSNMPPSMPPPGMYGAAPPKRPLGVTILAILSGLGGLGEIVAGFALIGVAALGATALAGAGIPAWIAGLAAVLGAVILILGLVTLVVAIGLWRMRGWAWWVAIVVNILSIILNAATLSWFGVIIPLIIVIYLVVIRDKFGVGGRPAGM